LAAERVAREDFCRRRRPPVRDIGGLDYGSGHVVHQINTRKDEGASMTLLTFLAALAHDFSADETLVVVPDNASYHQSHALQEWWRAETNQLQRFFLPASAPQLNLIERLWRYLKYQRVCHR
jgi:hypothetical protein